MIQATQYSRKLDSTGRLVIPKSLRDEYGLDSGEEYNFVVCTEESTGRVFLGIECTPASNQDLRKAIELVRRNGMRVTQIAYNDV